MATSKSRGIGRGGIRPLIRIVPKPPTDRRGLLRSTSLRGGSLAWLALAASAPAQRRVFSRTGATAALLGGVLALSSQAAFATPAPCTNVGQVWTCANGAQDIQSKPQKLVTPTADGWQVNIGSGGTSDLYRDTGNFQSTGTDTSKWNLGVLEIFNTDKSGTVTVSSGSKLAGQEADGIRIYDTEDGTPTLAVNVYGQVLGGTKAWTVSPALPEPGDGIHVGRPGVNYVDPEYTMGSFILNVGSASETGAVVEGGDNGVYIAQGVSDLASVTNYGTIIGVGNRNPTNWGEGVHISRVAKGQGDTFQIAGAATVVNYGDIEGHAAGGVAEGDADGPGSGVNVSAEGDILIGNYASNASGSIVGTDGVVAYGGGANAITVANTGHIEGTYGSGITVTHGGVGSITNHSFHSVIGAGGVNSDGVDAEDFHQVIFDNEGGLTAGISGSGALISGVSGVGESGDAVHVNNTGGGLIAGYTGGLVIQNVTGSTSESEANNVYIDNHAASLGEGDYAPGGIIVGAGAGSDGIDVSHVYASTVGSESALDSGSVTIDNRNTTRTTIDLGTITDSSVYAVGEGDTQTGLLGTLGTRYADPENPQIDTGIYGDHNAVSLSGIGGGVNIYNEDGWIYGWNGGGVVMSEIGGDIDVFNNTSSGNSLNSLIGGNQVGVGVDGFWGNVDIENGGGRIGGAYVGVHVTDAMGSGQQVTVANTTGVIGGQYDAGVDIDANAAVTVTNGESGVGTISGTTGVLVEGGDAYDIAVANSGHIEGTDGAGIQISHGAIGSITNHSFHSVIGSGGSSGVDAENFDQVIFDNEGGLTAGISAGPDVAGATISEVSGVGHEGQNAVTVYNSEGGLLAGYNTGLVIRNVTGDTAEGDAADVYIDNAAAYDRDTHSYTAGGAIIGLYGAGVFVSNVLADGTNESGAGSVTVDNRNTLHSTIDFSQITDSSVYEGESSSGLLGAFADANVSDGLLTTGIYGATAIRMDAIGGGVTVNNQDGFVDGFNGDGAYLTSIGGDIAVNNGRSWRHGEGGTIVGLYDGIDINTFYGNVNVDNAHGDIAGQFDGVIVSDAQGIGQTVTVTNGDGTISANGLRGIGVNLSLNGTSTATIDNSAGWRGDGGEIYGGTYGVEIGDAGVVDIANRRGAIYASETGEGAAIALSDVGRVDIGNAGGSIFDTFAGSDGVSMVGVGEGADIDNAASWRGDGGTITGTEHGILGSEIEGGISVENAAGLIAGLDGEGIHFGTVLSSNEAGYAVAIDNSSAWRHDGGIVAGATNGIAIDGVGTTYAAGNNVISIDNSGSESGSYTHAGGLIAGATGDGVQIYNAESDVQIVNDYTRANGSLDISETGVAGIAALSEAGGDFLSPSSTGIWGIGGAGIDGYNIAGSVHVSNVSGQIVGLADDGAAIQLSGIGSGLTPGGTAVEIDNSSSALAGESGAIIGDLSRYSLLSGGDYGVLLQDIQNGDVVFHNDLGVTYGDEMAFALNGLSEGDVLITNQFGVMEGHNGSSGVFPTQDSYGAITIANVGGHVAIDNTSSNGAGDGGEIIGVDSASAIYLAGGITSATIDNGYAYENEAGTAIFGGLIAGSGTEANAVIVMNTSTGESDTPDAANGLILNHGIIASTNLLGFSDPDVTGENTDLTAVVMAVETTALFVDNNQLPSWASEGEAFQGALAAIDNHNAGADGISAARDLAVQSETGAVAIYNQTAIIGRVDLTGSNAGESGVVANTFENDGLWYTEGANYLGAGGTIQNDGIIQTAFGSEGDLNTSFDVADFHNDSNIDVGYLSMLDGIAGNSVTITGNFHGADAGSESGYSYVALDAYLDASVSEGGAPAADMLHVEGNVTGTTGLVINNLNPNPINALNTDGIKVVQVDGESGGCSGIACETGDPFFISSKSTNYLEINGIGTVEQGLYAWYLTDPTESGHEYDLVTAALPTADQTPELLTAFANIFYNGITDLVSDHIYGGSFDPTDTSGGADVAVDGQPDHKPNGAMWGRISGAWSRQDTTVNTGLGPVDTGFNQNTYTMLGGLDMSPSGDGTGLRFGAYGGYISSNADFDSYAATGKYTGGVAGGYVAYSKDDFYIDTQLSADFVNLKFDAPLGAGVTGSVNGATYGVLADTGKRFYSGASFIEPIASFAYANTSLGDMQSGTATISFSNGESVRGGLGARVGIATTDASGVHVEMSLLGRVWDEFSGNNLVTVTDGANTDTFVDDTAGISGEVSATATLVSPDRSTSVFASGGATFKSDATTLNAKAGVRKSF